MKMGEDLHSLKNQIRGLSERDMLVLDALARYVQSNPAAPGAPVRWIRDFLPKGSQLSSMQVSHVLHKIQRRGIIIGVKEENMKDTRIFGKKVKWWKFTSEAKFRKYKKLRSI